MSTIVPEPLTTPDAALPPQEKAQEKASEAKHEHQLPECLQFAQVVFHPAFEGFVLCAIFVTCLQLALYDPYDTDDSSTHNTVDKIVDYVCLAIFTIELILKHAALGWRSYWAEGWNRLDALVVVAGFVTLAPSMDKLVVMRVLRVLRPLRVVNKLQGMKKIVNTLINSAKPLADTGMLCTALLFILGIVALTLFQGVTRQQCYTVSGTTYTLDTAVSRHCGGEFSCPTGDLCLYSLSAPNFSMTSFDQIFVAFLTIFVAVTQEGWTDVMYIVQDAYGYWVATIFFLFLIIAGALFAVELALAVLADSFGEDLDEEDEEEAEEEAEEGPSEQCTHTDEVTDLVTARAKKAEENAEKEREREAKRAELAASSAPPTDPFRLWCYNLGSSELFGKVIVGFIVLNTATMCMDHKTTATVNGVEQAQDMDQDLANILEICNYIFIGVFALEAAIKLIGFGGPMYFADNFNTFDFVIVLFSFLEIAVAGGGPISVLRTFRLMRIMKLAKRWRSMRVVLNTILDTLPQMGYLMLSTLLFIFMAAVSGMQLFGGKLTAETLGEKPRSNFDNFGIASLTVFQILTGENWNEVLYNSVEATGEAAIIYYVIVVVIGTFVVLNLTLAILLSNFGAGEDVGAAGSDEDDGLFATIKDCLPCWKSSAVSPTHGDARRASEATIPVMKMDGTPLSKEDVCPARDAVTPITSPVGDLGFPPDEYEYLQRSPQPSMRMLPPLKRESPLPGEVVGSDSILGGSGTGSGLDTSDGTEEEEPELNELSLKVGALKDALAVSRTFGAMRTKWVVETQPEGEELAMMSGSVATGLKEQLEQEAADQAQLDERKDCLGFVVPVQQKLTGVSLGIFGPENSARVFMSTVVVHPLFDNIILLLICLSSITLAMDGPTLDSDSDLAKALEILDILFTAIFVIEMFSKIFVYCFLFDDNAYLRNPWNQLDFFIVTVSVLSVVGLLESGGLRALRTLRALRPLRTIKRSPGLRCAVETIIRCLPPFFNISIVAGVCYLIFAIMGVQFWAGKFWKCDIETVSNVTECAQQGGNWVNAALNFDNVLSGMLTLFEVASLEIWLDVMYNSMDAPSEIGEQPIMNHRWWAAFYYVIFIIIGCFLVMNLFVGAVVDTFGIVKSEQERSGLLSESQAQFVASMRELFNNSPEPEPSPAVETGFRRRCFDLITFQTSSISFDNIIAACIGVNVLVMAANWWELPELGVVVNSDAAKDLQETPFNNALEWINLAFTIIFLLEATAKLLGLGAQQYFRSKLNTFDFVVVSVSVVGTILEYASSGGNSALVDVLLVFRVARVLRILRLALRFAGIKRLMQTLLFTLPAVINVLMLLVLLIFIYAVLGMSFFGHNPYVTEEDHGHYALYNEHANFRYFQIAFVTLFRMTTGESWNGIMHDVMQENGAAASVYFVSFMIIAASLLLNLVIAILLEEFQAKALFEKNAIRPADLENFTKVWTSYDPQATMNIPAKRLAAFLQDLDEPLGVSPDEAPSKAQLVAIQLEVPRVGGYNHFTEVFSACARRVTKVATLDAQVLADVMGTLHRNNPNLAPL